MSEEAQEKPDGSDTMNSLVMPKGMRAYSDCQDHVIVRLKGVGEYGMDLICATRLLRDLRIAVENAAGFDPE